MAGDDERLQHEIGRIADALDDVLRAPDGLAALEVLLRYLLATHVRMPAAKVGRLLLTTAGPQGQEVIVDVLDEFKLEGRREGKREGKREARMEVLLELLAARFGRVSADSRARIKAATEAKLAKWTVRVLTAPTLESVFDGDRARAAAPRRAPTPRPAPAARRTAAPRRTARKQAPSA